MTRKIKLSDTNTDGHLQIFYLIGFALFAVESMMSIWVIQVQNSAILIFTIIAFILGVVCFFIVFFCSNAASLHVFPGQWESCGDEAGSCKIDNDVSAMTQHITKFAGTA